MTSQHARHFLHRLEPGAHDLHAPLVQERTGPIDRPVRPEGLEGLAQQHGPNRSEVMTHQIPQPRSFLAGLVLVMFEQQPVRFGQQG